MASRCFNGPRRAITTSSDLTAAKRDLSTYEDLRSIAANPKASRVPGFSIDRCLAPGGPSARLRSAQSYELLDSVARGKALANPLLEGAGPEALDGLWGAGLQTLEYGASGAPVPLSSFTGLPSSCAEDGCPWVGLTALGYVIDASSNYSYSCIPAPGSKRISPWHVNAKLGFTSSPAYWAAVNAQPLQGMRFRSPIGLGEQIPASKFAPGSGASGCSLPPTISKAAGTLPRKCTYAAFCAGKGTIN